MRPELLGLQLDSPLAHPEAMNFRPPHWPPPPDWAPVVDAFGNAQCMYSDSVWKLDVWAGSPLKINFGTGTTRGAHVSSVNAELLRQCATWFMWGPRGCRTAETLVFKLTTIKPLFVACTKAGISATDLTRFDKVVDSVAELLPRAKFNNAITILHDLLDAREYLGFCILDSDGLARLARLAPDHSPRQTPYIPIRIWSYQLTQLRGCLEDFTSHQEQISECFQFCLEAYAHNFRTLEEAVSQRERSNTPFQDRPSTGRFKYHGPFKLTAKRFGVLSLIEEWVAPFKNVKGETQLNKLSAYLDLVSMAGLAYILNFSLMRVEEAWSLRSDCLHIEKDEKFGNIYILSGETTKTDSDADARWPTCEAVALAVNAMKRIAALRMRCAIAQDSADLTAEDRTNPYLVSYQYEPWSKGKHRTYRTRPSIRPYQGSLVRRYPKLFDCAHIALTEEDLQAARLITPCLNPTTFQVGRPWPFAWHQLRRTGAVNMLSSEMVDESSLQLLLKHERRAMTLYYGRNHCRLALNRDARTLFLRTMYQEMSRTIRDLSSSRYVSPLGQERKEDIVNFIRFSDAKSLEKSAKQGKVAVRVIRAGLCVNPRPCPYGGGESIAHCLGSEEGGGCPDLLVDTHRAHHINAYEDVVDAKLAVEHPDSPRHGSLLAEKRAALKHHEIVKAEDR